MRQRFQFFLVFFAWFMATGSQWDLAQLFAWGRMFVGYSHSMSLMAAATETFSGEMCEVCKAVQTGRQQQGADGQKTPEAKAPGKILLLCPPTVALRLVLPMSSGADYARVAEMILSRERAAPPTPPPRMFA